MGFKETFFNYLDYHMEKITTKIGRPDINDDYKKFRNNLSKKTKKNP